MTTAPAVIIIVKSHFTRFGLPITCYQRCRATKGSGTLYSSSNYLASVYLAVVFRPFVLFQIDRVVVTTKLASSLLIKELRGPILFVDED